MLTFQIQKDIGTMTTKKLINDSGKFLQMNRACVFISNNIFFYDGWECDVMGITHDDRIIEVEVKISKSDFIADFDKKGKHYQTSNGNGASQFYYAVPVEMREYARERLPDYAGLLSYYRDQNSFIKQYVKAPTLHNNRIDPNEWKKLAIKLFDKL